MNLLLNLKNANYDKHLRKDYNKYRNKLIVVRTKNSYLDGILKNFYLFEFKNKVIDSCFTLFSSNRIIKVFGNNVMGIYLENKRSIYDLTTNNELFIILKKYLEKKLNEDVINIIFDYISSFSTYLVI